MHFSVSVAQEAHPSYIHLVLTPLTQVYPISAVQLLELLEEDEDELDPDPELDPVHVPSVVQLVQVLLPALVYRVLQLEQEVAVPPEDQVPEEQATQFEPLR